MADGSLNGDNCYNLLKYLFDGYARNPSMPDGWPPMTIMSGAVSDLCQSMVLNEITVGPVMQESVVDSMNDTMHRSMSVFSRIANDHLHLNHNIWVMVVSFGVLNSSNSAIPSSQHTIMCVIEKIYDGYDVTKYRAETITTGIRAFLPDVVYHSSQGTNVGYAITVFDSMDPEDYQEQDPSVGHTVSLYDQCWQTLCRSIVSALHQIDADTIEDDACVILRRYVHRTWQQRREINPPSIAQSCGLYACWAAWMYLCNLVTPWTLLPVGPTDMHSDEFFEQLKVFAGKSLDQEPPVCAFSILRKIAQNAYRGLDVTAYDEIALLFNSDFAYVMYPDFSPADIRDEWENAASSGRIPAECQHANVAASIFPPLVHTTAKNLIEMQKRSKIMAMFDHTFDSTIEAINYQDHHRHGLLNSTSISMLQSFCTECTIFINQLGNPADKSFLVNYSAVVASMCPRMIDVSEIQTFLDAWYTVCDILLTREFAPHGESQNAYILRNVCGYGMMKLLFEVARANRPDDVPFVPGLGDAATWVQPHGEMCGTLQPLWIKR